MTVLQRGSAALPTMLLILMMGALLLNVSRRQLENGMIMLWDEAQYQQAWQDAQSALNWGRVQSWSAEHPFRCLRLPGKNAQVCLLALPDRQLLLRGEGGIAPYSITLWQWVVQKQRGLVALRHGWIDFCPLANREECEVKDGRKEAVGF